jgi:hypothetical protein
MWYIAPYIYDEPLPENEGTRIPDYDIGPVMRFPKMALIR